MANNPISIIHCYSVGDDGGAAMAHADHNFSSMSASWMACCRPLLPWVTPRYASASFLVHHLAPVHLPVLFRTLDGENFGVRVSTRCYSCRQSFIPRNTWITILSVNFHHGRRMPSGMYKGLGGTPSTRSRYVDHVGNLNGGTGTTGAQLWDFCLSRSAA